MTVEFYTSGMEPGGGGGASIGSTETPVDDAWRTLQYSIVVAGGWERLLKQDITHTYCTGKYHEWRPGTLEVRNVKPILYLCFPEKTHTHCIGFGLGTM